ncbi:MAG TPA: HAD-IA family hydrolase [Rhizomicrobium sp.]|jgi:HAD superfamily hydrolase (TIGR01509 family)
MGLTNISPIIFDCDGVLVDSEVLAHEVEARVLSGIGLHYDPHEFKARFMGMSDAAFRAALEADGISRLGRSILPEIEGPMDAQYKHAIDTRLTAVRGALEAVRAVTGAKAVASSSQKAALEKKLRKTGLWDEFAPHVYSAQHVTHSKPAPDLFLHAANALGVSPADCLVIEDSVNGVNAGHAAGMRVWGFMGGGHMDEHSRARLEAARVERVIEDWPHFSRVLSSLS